MHSTISLSAAVLVAVVLKGLIGAFALVSCLVSGFQRSVASPLGFYSRLEVMSRRYSPKGEQVHLSLNRPAVGDLLQPFRPRPGSAGDLMVTGTGLAHNWGSP